MKAKHSKKKRTNYLSLIVLLACTVAMFVSGFHILKWVKENRQSKKLKNNITNTVKSEDENLIVDFIKLKEENVNTVAWIKLKGTNIEYPIVKGKDNSFYLTHSFDDDYNSAGWIFADYKNKFDGTDKHIVIYGHNRRDGSMFGTLKNVLDKKWCNNKDNRHITFVTEKGNLVYEVFSVYKIKNEDYYITTRFNSNDEFKEFINTLKDRSIYNFGIDVQKTDKILTLSTCADNSKYRIVLHAKKIGDMLP